MTKEKDFRKRMDIRWGHAEKDHKPEKIDSIFERIEKNRKRPK